MEFRRPYNTGDNADYEFTTNSINDLMWAFGDYEGAYEQHATTDRGSLTFALSGHF